MRAKSYELTIQENYVSDWNFDNAIRELIQNGIDQENSNENSEFTMFYSEENREISFINKNSSLELNTLLLGTTSKQGDDKTIGQFGEGYKIASLVLNRLNYTMKIFNGQKNEVWETKISESKKWGGIRILKFLIRKEKIDNNDLRIVVGNVTTEEYEDLSYLWIGLQSINNENIIETSFGRILKDEDQKNKVYINGIHIDCNCDFEFGYDFNANQVKIERDRKTCDSFNSKTITSKMISEAYYNNLFSDSELYEMIDNNYDDVYNLDIVQHEKISNMIISKLKLRINSEKDNNKLTVPVNSQEKYDRVKVLGGNPIIVSQPVYNIIKDEYDDAINELMNNRDEDEIDLDEKLKLIDVKFNSWIDKNTYNIVGTAEMEILRGIYDKLLDLIYN